MKTHVLVQSVTVLVLVVEIYLSAVAALILIGILLGGSKQGAEALRLPVLSLVLGIDSLLATILQLRLMSLSLLS